MPVARLRKEMLRFEANDQERRDKKFDAISLSILFPNQYIFYKYRMIIPGADWAVLELDPSIFVEPSASYAFYRTNAAHHKMRDLDMSKLATYAAFSKLFDEPHLDTPPI